MKNVAEKVKNCLTGAVYGAELGMLAVPEISPMETTSIKNGLIQPLDWDAARPELKHNNWESSLTPLIHLSASVYIKKRGRVTPEEFAEALKNDETMAASEALSYSDIYSAIERLREGMIPRLNGIGACPDGSMSPAAILTGIYHAGDPERAYIDAIELSSVVQRAPATEWAALAAAAVSIAFGDGCDAPQLVKSVMDMALRYCKDVYYEINKFIRDARGLDEDHFYLYWLMTDRSMYREYRGHNPIAKSLLLLDRYGSEAENAPKMLRLTTYRQRAFIHAPVLGAILGALFGNKLNLETPDRVIKLVEPMLPMAAVLQDKLNAETSVIREIEALTIKHNGGQTLLYDKILGCILAGAIGNAMGSPFEGHSYLEIDARHPGGVTTIIEPDRLESEDDNQVAMMLYRAYIARDGLPATAGDYADKWKDLMDRDNYYFCLRNTYQLLNSGMDPRICGHWNLVTGSALMCMEPAGVYNLADSANAYIDGTALSYMNQRGTDVTAAAILAAGVACAMQKGADTESVIQAVLDAAPRDKMITFDKKVDKTPYDYLSRCVETAGRYKDVLSARAELYEKCLCYHWFDPMEVLGLAVAVFLISKCDVKTAAIGGTNIGRDADSIAGRAAMLAGTVSGYGNIPAEWVSLVNRSSMQKIQEAAGKMEILIVEKKLPALKNRQL